MKLKTLILIIAIISFGLLIIISSIPSKQEAQVSQRVVFTSGNPPSNCAPGKVYTNPTLNPAKSWVGSNTNACTPDVGGDITPSSVTTASIKPPADSTTALQIFKNDGVTRVMDFDTTNARVGINKTPGPFDLDVNGAANIGSGLNVGASVTAGTFRPSADGTTALLITKADGTTPIEEVDTSNRRIGINKVAGAFDLDVNGAVNVGTSLTSATLLSASNCANTGGTCGSASAGAVTIAAAATTVTVNTTAVTANSEIFVQNDSSLGARLSVTCNTQSSLTLGTPRVTARSAGTSFTITIEVGPTTNPMCLNYRIVN